VQKKQKINMQMKRLIKDKRVEKKKIGNRKV
jgi:hypothetical protein